MTHPQDLSLAQQVELLAKRTVSAEEILEATLTRVGERDINLNSVAATFPNESAAMAKADRGGPLYGAPIAVKDMFSLPWRGFRNGTPFEMAPASASGMFRRLDEAGAVVGAVTNQHLLGMGTTGIESAYGPGANPWALDRCPGGSSGGSAAAVAARLFAGSVGSDTGGSTRIPAAYCGVVGLKLTFRSMPYDGYLGVGTTLSAPGLFGRESNDVRLLAEAVLQRPLPRTAGDGMRIGLVPEFWTNIDPAVEAACRAALEASGWSVCDITLEGAALAVAATTVRMTSEMSAFAPIAMLDQLDPMTRARLLYALLTPARMLVRADRVRALVRRGLRDALENVTAVAWPTVPATAPLVANPVVQLPSGPAMADAANGRQAALANFTGVPGISIPVGFDAGGLPIGLQLLGRWGDEGTLLDAAAHLEDATGRRHVDAVPPIAR